jgi:hypothetical protein
MNDTFNLTVEKLRSSIPQFDDIIEDTEMFLDTIYSDVDADFFDASCDDPSESERIAGKSEGDFLRLFDISVSGVNLKVCCRCSNGRRGSQSANEAISITSSLEKRSDHS